MKRGRKRSTAEFARIYGSKERVEWVKSCACMFCLNFNRRYIKPSENAHVCGNDGMGRKAGYETIVPLCASCHRRYDRYLKPFESEWVRERVRSWAPKVEARWQEQLIAVLHTTDPLCARCKASFREEGSVFCGSCQELNRQERPAKRKAQKPPRDAA